LITLKLAVLVAREAAKGDARVAQQRVEERRAVGVAAGFLDLLDAAKCTHRFVARGLGRQAGSAEPLYLAVQIVLELFAQVGFTLGAEEERSEVIAQNVQDAHAASAPESWCSVSLL
jgi:hypothetical protein